MSHPGRVYSRRMLLEALWGTRRLPRPAHDRRPRPAPAREDRGRLAPARDDPHGAQRRLPLPRHVNPLRSVGGTARARAARRRRRCARDRLRGRRPVVRAARSSTRGSADSTRTSARSSRTPLPADASSQQWVEEEAAPIANARVVVFQQLRGAARAVLRLEPAGGSLARRRGRPDRACAARSHARQRATSRGTVTRNGRAVRRGRVPAGPRRAGRDALARRCTTTSTSVGVVRKRVLVAGALAAVFAIVLGYALATLFARRIRRLDTRRRADRRRPLRRAGRRHRPRRARPARAHVRPHAGAARLARPRPRRVHRQRLARAADAAVLARGLPRAARERGARRRDARRLHGRDPRAR